VPHRQHREDPHFAYSDPEGGDRRIRSFRHARESGHPGSLPRPKAAISWIPALRGNDANRGCSMR
jgi:hypothetical protein